MFELQPCHYMKDFHNVFAYYGRSKPNEIKCQRNYIILFHMMLCLNIFMPKIYTSQHTKKCKYIQERIEMIFSIYEIYNIYQTL
jgi:hypothetical protein